MAFMNTKDLLEVVKATYIKYKDGMVDYPFQKNIHQLSKEELIDCLYDLFTVDKQAYTNFKRNALCEIREINSRKVPHTL